MAKELKDSQSPAKAVEIKTYKWDGRDSRGKKVSGEVQAKDLKQANAQLRKQNVTPNRLSVKKKDTLFTKLSEKPIKSRDVTFFTRQLSTMIDAGVPLVQGLGIIAGSHENPLFKRLVDSMRTEIESGSTLSDSMAHFPKYFDTLYINLIKVGEDAGILEEVLRKLADYREKTETLKAKVKKAMIYPAAVVTVSVAVTSIILIYVIPQFEKIFTSSGTDLPLLTRIVINASHIMAEWGWLILIGLGTLIFILFRTWKRSEQFQRTVGRLALKTPVLGEIMHNSSLARFARTLATTLAAGVPIVKALVSVSGATGNAVFTDAVLRIRDSVSTGQSLNFAMTQEPLYPNLMRQMIAIGEETGSLESLLGKIADYYDEAVDNAVDSLNSLLEPLIIVVLGVIVGTMVIAMYLPIFQFGNVVG
jgi:type IV pilus assembly protein PilC